MTDDTPPNPHTPNPDDPDALGYEPKEMVDVGNLPRWMVEYLCTTVSDDRHAAETEADREEPRQIEHRLQHILWLNEMKKLVEPDYEDPFERQGIVLHLAIKDPKAHNGEMMHRKYVATEDMLETAVNGPVPIMEDIGKAQLRHLVYEWGDSRGFTRR